MSTIAHGGFTVDQYEDLVSRGILPETNRFELIEGRIEEKEMKGPGHRAGTDRLRRSVERLLPDGWHTHQEGPIRLPGTSSEPEPDLSVVRGSIDDYEDRHPGPGDVALVVEVTRTTAAKDRRLARIYTSAGIPAYWIVNVPGRRLEVYTDPDPAAGAYTVRRVLAETEAAELVLAGTIAGEIPVSDLPPRPRGSAPDIS